jgi:hypothetical protein
MTPLYLECCDKVCIDPLDFCNNLKATTLMVSQREFSLMPCALAIGANAIKKNE